MKTKQKSLTSLIKAHKPFDLESRVKKLEEEMERVKNWARQIAPPEL